MDKATAQAHLDAWTAASLALASGQSYSIGGRSLSRVNADEVRNMIGFWQRAVNDLTTTTTARKPAAVATWT